MILDKLTTLATAQALTATAYSTDNIDLGDVTPKRDIGNGEPLALLVTVTVAADFTSANETYEFQFVQSANSDMSSHDVLAARVVPAAQLAVGDRVVIPVPKGAVTKRYVSGRAVLGGTTPSVTVNFDLLPLSSVEQYAAYADGFTIS